jgi:hypothetical protein
VRSLSARVSDLSRRAVLHTWAFKSLATQVTEASISVSASASNREAVRTWYALLEKHARAFGELSGQMRDALHEAGIATATTTEDAFSAASTVASVDSTVDSTTASVALAADALMRAGAHQDRTIRSLFVAGSDQPASDLETSLRALTHQLRVSRIVAHAAAQYCITRIQ